jgi:hypothetical protein
MLIHNSSFDTLYKSVKNEDPTPMSLQLIYPATRIQYFVTGSKQLKSKCQYFTIVPEFSPGIQNEDLSREIHEVTARPISHGPDPVVFRLPIGNEVTY